MGISHSPISGANLRFGVRHSGVPERSKKVRVWTKIGLSRTGSSHSLFTGDNLNKVLHLSQLMLVPL